jgi:hypothetical protein
MLLPPRCAFVCSHATSTQNFSFFVIRNFIWSFVPAGKILGQISVLGIGRPRHTPAAPQRRARIWKYEIVRKLSTFLRFTTYPAHFSDADTPRNYAVKYAQQYANLSTTSQVHTSQLGLHLHKSQRVDPRWGTAKKKRTCHIPTGT